MDTLNGTAYIIWIDTDTPVGALSGDPAKYRPVMCGKSNGFNMDIESISLRNKCDDGWDRSLGGYGTWGLDMDGFAIGLRNSDKLIKANFQEIARLAINKTIFWAKLEDVDTSITREGLVRISSYRETANLEEPYSFTVNFIGTGKPLINDNIFRTVISTDNTNSKILQDGNNNLIETKNVN